MKKLLLLLALACSAGIANAAPINESSQDGYFNVTGAADCAPEVLTFDQVGVTFPGAVYVKYHYGDGAVSGSLLINATPTHNYLLAGTYDVWSEYLNASGFQVGWDYVRIELYGDPGGVYPQQTSACPNDLVFFSIPMGWSSSPVNTYSWNFGDGNTEVSNWNNASHDYAAPGTYNVTVTINGPCGTYNYNTNFTVGTNVPFSGGYLYVSGPEESCPNEQIYFNFPNSYASYLITFGDGQFSNSDYYHTYTSVGDYPVSVTLTNGCGNSGTYYDTVHIVNNLGFNPNQQIYIYNSSPICPGQEVHFDTWNGYGQVEWHFSDGTTETGYYAQHTITSMTDDTTWVDLTNGCGADTTVMSIVTVSTNLPVTEIDLTTTDSVCTGSYFPFLADGGSELESDYEYSWNFGDGNTSETPNGTYAYANPGTYTISLTVVNGCGNDSTQTAQIFVGPGIAPDPNSQMMMVVPNDASCPGDTVMVVIFPYVPGTYSFDFGDGFVSSNVFTLELQGSVYGACKHAYSATGSYNIAVTYTNSCALSYTKNISYQVSSGVMPDENEGMFYDESLSICLGEPITFYSYGGAQYQWNFGDGSGSLITYNTMTPIEHVYDEPGVYTVSLQLTNGCGNTSSLTTSIVIPDNHIDIVTNTVDATCGEADGKAIAVINGGNDPYNIYWSNGATGILVDSLTSGIYVVNVTDQNDCYNFGIATVSDAQAPAIVLNTVVDVTCNGGNDGALDINVIGSTGPYSFDWSNGATSEDQSGLVAGPYEVYVTDANGCVATASFNVGEPEEVQVSFNVTNPSYMQGSCNISNGIVTANALGNTGPFTYVWNNGHNGNTLFGIPSGIYTVNVIDQAGCIITEQVAVSANNGLGGPIISVNSVSPLNCSGGGSNIDISVYFASGATMYNWNTGATTEDIAVTQEGTYIVTVTDALGCQAFEIIDIDNAAPAALNICMVTVDSIFNTNRVVFEKPFSTEIEYFKIYRESSQAGLYYHIGNVHYDSLSIFVDGVANPMVQAWRYKISAVDFCGEESALSPAHKTIHLNQNLGVVANTVNLIWDHYEGFVYGTYEIVRYTQSAGWVVIGSTSALNTSYTDNAAPLSDPTLFYVITANPPTSCVATRAQNNGTTRSNRTDNPVQPDLSGIVNNAPMLTNFNIYPNPNDGIFTIQMAVNESTSFKVEITDLLGQVVETFMTGNTGTFYTKTVDLSELSTGVYLVKVGNANGYVMKKIIKN